MCIDKAKMNGNGGRDTKEAANPGLFGHMVAHPIKEKLLGGIHAQELNQIIRRPNVLAPCGTTRIGPRRSRGKIQDGGAK